MDAKTKQKIKEAVKRHKTKVKTEGKHKIEGVTDPKVKRTSSKKKKDSKKPSEVKDKHKKPVVLGPRGGQYRMGGQGSKYYQTKQEKVKKSLESFVEQGNDLIKSFLKKWKGEK
jgi:Ni,Fe-hydrogenase I large subunit